MIPRGTLMTALDMLVLEPADGGGFVLGAEPPPWLALLGAAPSPAEPRAFDHLLPFLEAFLPDAEAAWSSEPPRRVRSCIWTQVTPSGEALHLEASALRVGSSRLLVVTRADALFEEQRRVLQRARELSQAHAALSHEIERKDVLIHCIVHDLAGPLNSILGVLSLLEERALATAEADLVHVAVQAALRQRELIREILDTFAAERTALDGASDDFALAPDLFATLAQVLEALGPTAASRGVRLSCSPAGPKPLPVIGDERRLSRVLVNLLENAIRFTPKGRSVRVHVGEEPASVRVAIEDEGPGVPAALATHLFQKFACGRDPSTGTGLGLYFCRITVENWGGAIGYEPRPEGGARFWVRLRRAPEAPRDAGGEDGQDPGRR